MTFSEYYNQVCDELVEMGEDRSPDLGTVEEDHANGLSVKESAQAFYDDCND